MKLLITIIISICIVGSNRINITSLKTEQEQQEINNGKTYEIFEDNKSDDEEENEKDLKLRHLQESENGFQKPSHR